MQEKFLGTVIHGLGKGKVFGFPTANIKLIDNELNVDSGVYAVAGIINNKTFHGMLYVGTRPTFDLKDFTIEIHLFDFNEEIYDMQISFQILHKIRNEIHFETIEKFIKQLHQDKEMVYKYFLNPSVETDGK
jgi:riboflavin kinase/FMN adenylyltransferase